MFNKLIASAPGQRSWLRNPTVIFVSIIAHLLILAGVVWATTGGEPEVEEAEPEQVTYIDITELPAPDPEELFEAPPEPEEPPAAEETPPAATPTPPAPRRAPAQPRAPQPAATPSEEPAGFQELSVPDVNVQGIPEPDVSAAPVRPEDFGGRGAAGGTASGVPAPPPPPSSATGTGSGSGSGSGSGNQTYSSNLVDEEAELTNRGDIARILSRNYPRNLRDAGIEGRVVVQFVVNQRGRVEPGTIKIMSTSEKEFADATREALEEFRFRPGKVQGQSVRQIVQIPIEWKVAR